MDFKLILVAVLVSVASAGPTGNRYSECAPQCDPNSQKFFYEIGRQYEYDYEAETRTTLIGGSDQDSLLKVSAKATIQPASPCEYILSLSDVSLHGSARSEAFASEVTKQPLRFSIQKGRIEHICGAANEATWVINFKKGILSNLQNSMNNIQENEVLTETDVSGICETSYTSKREGSETIVTRTKKPSECELRPRMEQTFSSFGYSADALIQGLPIMASNQQCLQTISDEIIREVTCEEVHLFQPFQQRGSGAQTKTTTTFKLSAVNTGSALHLEYFSTRNELSFDFEKSEKDISRMTETESILMSLKSLTENGIKKGVPGVFSTLVTSLRGLTQSEIVHLFESNEPKIRTFIADALPLVKTAESMGAFVQLSSKGSLEDEQVQVWYTSLAFIKNPTLKMFDAIQSFLSDVSENKAILGVSSMIHNYCMKNSQCQDIPSIQTLLRNIESHLGNGCRTTSEEERTNIIYALKALGNAGRFVNAESVLKRCYIEDNIMEIRIAAIDAWRHTPCDYNRDHLLSTYTDETQDNEVRIAAYLGLMKCPTQHLVDTLKDRLLSEGVNQVSSFVWTHLSNLQETAAQEKQWIRHLIGEEILQKKFSTEALKLSRNYESSFFLKEQEFGASIDSNVIFSGKSFLPRSSMANLTIDLFGEAINLFEVGGRIEGFESYIEKFFGPDGYYPEETIEAIIKNWRQDKTNEETQLESLITKDGTEPKGSFYLKLFGNELFYRNFNGIESLFSEMSFSNVFDVILELATKGNIDYTKTYNLVNSEFTFPTITGFPINLNLNGIATVGLKLDGNFNFNDFSSLDIQGKLHPSAAVKIDASMLVDAFVTKSGIKLVTSLHSSTSAEGRVKIENGKVADFTINVPNEKIEIFDIQNEFFRIDNGEEIPENKNNNSFKKCLPFISNSLGMEMCYEKSTESIYAPYFPVSLPYKMEVFLGKTDTHSSYTFHYSKLPTKTILLLDMPGSETDKKWSAEMTIENQKYEIDLHSPCGSSKGMISYQIGKKGVNLQSELSFNDFKVYGANFNIATEEKNNHRQSKVELLLESSIVQGKMIDFTGEYDFDKETKSVNAQVSLQGNLIPSFKTNINLNKMASENSLSFGFESVPFEMKLSGRVGQLTSDGMINMSGQYRLYNSPLKSLTTSLTYQRQISDQGLVYSGVAEIEELDFKTDARIEIAENSLKTKLSGKMSQITWELENDYSYVSNQNKIEIIFTHYSLIPNMNIDLELNHHTIISAEQFLKENNIKFRNWTRETKLSWNYGQNFLVYTKTSYPNMNPNQLKIQINKVAEGTYNLEYLSKFYEYSTLLEGSLDTEISEGKFKSKIKGLYNNIKPVDTCAYDFLWTISSSESHFKSDINLNCDGNDVSVNIDATKTSLNIDSNLYIPFTAQAKVEDDGKEKRFSIMSELDNVKFTASGSVTPENLQGTLRYKEQEIKLLARLLERGFELDVQLSPQHKFGIFVNYTLGRKMSLDLGLETPFPGWEKQDASFSLNTLDSIQGQVSITWQNTHHIGLTVEFKSEPRTLTPNFVANCRWSSTIEDFERFELLVNHSMSNQIINTKFKVNLNSQVMEGNFDSYPTEDGYNLDMNLMIPIIEKCSISFNHKMTDQDVYTSLDVAYGSKKSRVIFKANIIDYKNMNGSFICISPFLPDITVNVAMQSSSTGKNIEVNGKYNGQKALFVANCEKFMSIQETLCKMSMKMVAPSFKVFSANFSNKFNFEKEFETTAEIASDFISEQNIKCHIEGKLTSITSAVMNGYISGPKITGRINLNHNITNDKLQSDFNFELNSFRIGIVLGGNIDLESMQGSLHGEMNSTLALADGFKITLHHFKQNEARETSLSLSKKGFNINLYHNIVFKNKLNWLSLLKINDTYKMENEMKSTEGIIKHALKLACSQKEVKLALSYEKYGSKGMKLSIFNQDWNEKPLIVEFNVKHGVDKEYDFNIDFNKILSGNVHIYKKNEMFGGNMIMAVNRANNIPMSFTGKFSSTKNEKESYIEFKTNEKYSIDFKLTGDKRSGKISSITFIPVFFKEPVKSTVIYNFVKSPMRIVLTNMLKDNKYDLETRLDDNQFMVKSICPSGEGNLKVNWEITEVKKNFMLDFKSPFEFVNDIKLNVKYNNLDSKIIDCDMSYDIHKINFKVNLNNQLFEFDCNTTLPNWENLKMKFETSEYDFSVIFSKNNDVQKLSGSGSIGYPKGKYSIRFNLPALGFEIFSSEFEYSFDKQIAVHMQTKYGSSQYLVFNVEYNFDNIKTIKINIQSPFEQIENVRLESTIEESSMKMNGNFNKFKFDSLMEFNFDVNRNGNVKFTVHSNIPNWKFVTIEANVNLSQSPFTVSFTSTKDNEVTLKYILTFSMSAENNFHLEIKTPITSMEHIIVNGNYKYQQQRFKTSFILKKNSDNINFSGSIDFKNSIPEIKINVDTPFANKEKIELNINGNMLHEKSFNFILRIGDQSYNVNVYKNFIEGKHTASVKLSLPVSGIRDFNINMSYDIVNPNKHIMFEMERNRIKEVFSIEGKYDFHQYTLTINTPVENFEKIILSGFYSPQTNGVYEAHGKIIRNSNVYNFTGKAVKKEEGYAIEINVPINSYDSLTFNGEINKQNLSMQVMKGNTVSEFSISYMLNSNKAFIKINTPFNDYKYLAIGGEYEVKYNDVSGSLYVHKNSEHIEIEGSFNGSPQKSNLEISFATPSSDSKYHLQVFYDIISEQKGFGIIIQNDKTITKYLVKTLYNGRYHGFIKLFTPIPGYEQFGFEYKFKNVDVTDTETFVTLINNSDEITFGIQSKITKNELLLQFKTPFTNFKTIGIDSKMDIDAKDGKCKIIIGNYVLAFEVSFRPENFTVSLKTPFSEFETLRMSSKYGWDITEKFILLEFIYNDVKFELNGNAIVSRDNPQINFKIISPFEFINIFEIMGKLNLNNPSELLDMNFNFNFNKYILSFGYMFDDLKASLNLNATLPVDGWTSTKINANIDLQSNNKVLNISFEREGISTSVYLTGNLFDNDIDFDLQTNFDEISNFKTKGSFNRSKRSVAFNIMNDQYSGGIVANFNSLEIKGNTPYAKLKDVSVTLSKDKKGGWTFNYMRNNKQVYVNISVQPKKKGFNISIDSDVPGWQFLALTGRLSLEEFNGYITGQLNSENVHISGKGLFGEKTGSLVITGTSGFEKYKEVITKIEYNKKRKIFTFESVSNSSDFKILFEFKKGLVIDVFVPNPVENTVVKGSISPFKGNLTASSRFRNIRTFSIKYIVKLGSVISITATIERNGVNIFEFEFTRDSTTNKAHVMIHGKRGNNHSMLHFLREGLKKIEFVFNRNGREYNVNISSQGQVPVVGKMDFTIKNSFIEPPRTVSGTVDIDRSSSPKKITLDVDFNNGRVYQFNLTYNATLDDMKSGDFVLTTVTPERSMSPWKNISGFWKVDNQSEGKVFIKAGPREYTATGKFELFDTKLIIESNVISENYFMQWKLKKQGNSRDYFIKVGRENRFVMLKLDGTFDTIFNGDVTGAFRFSRFMANDFDFTAKWSRNEDGLTGNGNFNFGEYSGTHNLINFKRNPSERAATFQWEGTSNIDDFKKITLIGNYNLIKRFVDIKLSWDTDEISLNTSLDNMTLKKSENIIKFHTPSLGSCKITLSHDFTKPLERSIKAIGNIGGENVSYVATWTRNENLTKFDFTADIDSALLGKIHMTADFDVRDVNNSNGSLEYKRNIEKNVSIKWSRVKTSSHLKDELVFNSHFIALPTARIYLDADWKSGLEVNFGIQLHNKAIEGQLNVGPKKTTAYLNTPFPKFGNINVQIDYDLKKAKSKSVTFKYTRGSQVIDMNFNLNISSKKNGSIKLSLVSPFPALENLNFNATWKKGKFEAEYKRNDKTISINGDAEIKADKSSFNLKFTPPSGNPVEVQFSYHLQSFIKGGTTPKNLISAKLLINGKNIEFHVKGNRTPENVFIEIDGSTSLDVLNKFYLKLDSELNLNNREGQFEIRIDDFHFDIKNSLEKRPKGFYARSQIHSSMTALPGLTIGFGRDADSFILTTGFGDEREINLTLKGKDHFRKGFFGVIDMPRRGIHGLEYDINYSFKGDNKLQAGFKIKVGEGQHIEADIVYNSDGVKGRFYSPLTGLHSARMRRSISDEHFMADIGVDNYGFAIVGDYNKNSFKKGFKIEGEIFGEKVLIGGHLNTDTLSKAEGKLIIETPFNKFEKLGGSFQLNLSEQRIYGEINMNLLYKLYGKVDLDLVNKVKGDGILKLENLVYEISCDLMATENHILKGNIIVKTPHSSFEKIVIGGTINNRSFKNFQASLSVELPAGPYSFDISMALDEPLYSLDMTLRFNVSTEIRLLSKYSLVKYPFYLKGNSFLHYNGQEIFSSKSEVMFNDFKNMRGSYETKYNEINLNGLISLAVEKEFISGEVMANVGNLHSVEIKVNAPIPLNQFEIKSSYKYNKIQIIHFEIQKDAYLKKVLLNTNQFNFNISLINDVVNQKFTSEIEISFPFYNNKMTYFVHILKHENSSGELTAKLNYKNDEHIIRGQISFNQSLVKLFVNIDSPFLRNDDANIIITCDFDNKIHFSIESTMFNRVHNLYVNANRKSGILINCVSPYIPTGMAKLEGNLIVHSVKNMHLLFAYSDTSNTISAEGKVKWNVDNETEVYIEIRTPFEDYKKVEFGLNLITEEITRIALFANPFNLKAESFFGVESSIFNAGMVLQTGDQKNQLTKAEAIVPLTKFEPAVSAYYDEVEYNMSSKVENTEFGGEFIFVTQNINLPSFDVSYRTKAPYEIDLDFPTRDYKFGIIFDSSFWQLVA